MGGDLAPAATVEGALRDVRIQVKEGVHIPAVAGEFNHRLIGQSLANGLIFGIDGRRLHRHHDGFLRRGNLEHSVGAHRVATVQDDVRDSCLTHSSRRDCHFICTGLQPQHLVVALRIRFCFPRCVGKGVRDRYRRARNDGPRGVGHRSANGAEIRSLTKYNSGSAE